MRKPIRDALIMSKQAEAILRPSPAHETTVTQRAFLGWGASLLRGPRALFLRMLAFGSRPEVSVWAAPAGRALSMVGLLSCVAFLGAQSKAEEAHGTSLEVNFHEGAGVLQAAPATDRQESVEAGGPLAAVPLPAPSPCSEKSEARPSGVLNDGRIILNEASAADFTRLKGVGEARAAAIVALRERLGKFRKVADLMRVKGIGPKTIENFKDQVVVDRPAVDASEAQEAPALSPSKSPVDPAKNGTKSAS